METSSSSPQQFHLKWNNHSLNTLTSFQQLLDTNTLVDVTLTCCNGKTITAHQMVLAACSQYFYNLFKELPEKHPVIIFKDAKEEIIRDLLLFMYKGEVEVQESHLNDFLKFAETLQVKGLSQCDKSPTGINATANEDEEQQANITPPSNPTKMDTSALPLKNPLLPDVTKSYLANLAKFPPLFPLPTEPPHPTDLLTHLSSPNLYRALHHRKYGGSPGKTPEVLNVPNAVDNPMLKTMPFLNLLYPNSGVAAMRDDNDNDTDRSVTPPTMGGVRPPSAHQSSKGTPDDNDDKGSLPMDSDYSTPPPPPSSNQDHNEQHRDSDSSSTGKPVRRGGSKPSAGRGSRLERMIAAEYKIMSEYAEQNQELPVMTPELMKSRRTHSLQLAIGEILHNQASVQSAATKYHIPRETLRRHYQRYLKAMGLQNPAQNSKGGGGSAASSGGAVRAKVATNNNATKMPMDASNSADEASNGFSSLLDIGQAYGIWNPDLDAFKAAKKEQENLTKKEDKDKVEKEKELIIDEDEKDEDEDEKNIEVDIDDEKGPKSETKTEIQDLTKPNMETMST